MKDVEGATLRVVGARMVAPAPGLVLAQTALLLLGALLLRRLRAPLAPSVVALALAALALAALGAQQELTIYRYVARLAVALALLAGLTFWLLPHAERRLSALGTPELIRALWGLMLLACMIRLAGALYPLTGWLLSPMVAAAAMSLSSVSVIGNALRLRTVRLE